MNNRPDRTDTSKQLIPQTHRHKSTTLERYSANPKGGGCGVSRAFFSENIYTYLYFNI